MQQGSVKAGSNFGPEMNMWPWYLLSLPGPGQLTAVTSSWAGAELTQRQ